MSFLLYVLLWSIIGGGLHFWPLRQWYGDDSRSFLLIAVFFWPLLLVVMIIASLYNHLHGDPWL